MERRERQEEILESLERGKGRKSDRHWKRERCVCVILFCTYSAWFSSARIGLFAGFIAWFLLYFPYLFIQYPNINL